MMTFPLTHEPAEFVHPDRTIRTTTKSSVTNLFDMVKIGPKKVDSVIIDGMFLLRNLTVPLRHTLRGLVWHVLIKALKMSEQRVDSVLNTYNLPCLKDITRDIRGDDLDMIFTLLVVDKRHQPTFLIFWSIPISKKHFCASFMKKFKRMSMQVSLIIKFFIAR